LTALAPCAVLLGSARAEGGIVALCESAATLAPPLRQTVEAIQRSLAAGQPCAALAQHLGAKALSLSAVEVDLAPLSEFRELEMLDLYYEHLRSDLRPLAALRKMTYFHAQCSAFNACTVADVASLGALTQVTNLSFALYNETWDTRILAPLRDLEQLAIPGNQVLRIDGVAALEKLRVLGLSSNGISDLAPLHQLVSLQMLTVNDNPFPDIDWAMSLVNVRDLNLSSNKQLESIWGVRYMMNLATLDLSGTNLKSIAPLAELPWLTWVRLSQNRKVTDWQVLESLPRLAGISLDATNVPLDLLDRLPKEKLTSLVVSELGLQSLAFATRYALSQLIFDNNEIKDLAPLAKIPTLRSLMGHRNQVSDLTALASLPDLSSLTMSNNQIRDVAPLAGLESLRSLTLQDNQITSLEALANHPGLETLEVSGNQITDLSVVKTMPKLRQLHACGNPLADKTCPRADLWICRTDC
jgi:internalin A